MMNKEQREATDLLLRAFYRFLRASGWDATQDVLKALALFRIVDAIGPDHFFQRHPTEESFMHFMHQDPLYKESLNGPQA